MSYTKGKNVSVYVYDGLTPVFSGCATATSRSASAEKRNITTVDSGRNMEYTGGALDESGTLEALTTLDEINKFQYSDWYDAIGTVIRLLMVYENDYGDKYSWDSNVLVDGVNDRTATGEFVSFNVNWTRTGAATITRFFNALLDSDGNPVLDSDGLLIR